MSVYEETETAYLTRTKDRIYSANRRGDEVVSPK
jgi:hypothetical protein